MVLERYVFQEERNKIKTKKIFLKKWSKTVQAIHLYWKLIQERLQIAIEDSSHHKCILDTKIGHATTPYKSTRFDG